MVFMLWVAPAWAAPLRLLSRIVLADMGLGVTWLHGSCSPAATERTDLASSFIKCIVAAKKSSDLVSETQMTVREKHFAINESGEQVAVSTRHKPGGTW